MTNLIPDLQDYGEWADKMDALRLEGTAPFPKMYYMLKVLPDGWMARIYRDETDIVQIEYDPDDNPMSGTSYGIQQAHSIQSNSAFWNELFDNMPVDTEIVGLFIQVDEAVVGDSHRLDLEPGAYFCPAYIGYGPWAGRDKTWSSNYNDIKFALSAPSAGKGFADGSIVQKNRILPLLDLTSVPIEVDFQSATHVRAQIGTQIGTHIERMRTSDPFTYNFTGLVRPSLGFCLLPHVVARLETEDFQYWATREWLN